MRQVAMKLAIVMAITAIGIFAADNSIGTWKRNIEKSKSKTPVPNPYKNETTVREPVDGGIKVTSVGERKDGTPTKYSYAAKYDGKPVPVAGSVNFDTISVKQVDASTFSSEIKKSDGKYHTTARIVISKDGKTMTTTAKGTDAAGKPIGFTLVHEKQ